MTCPAISTQRQVLIVDESADSLDVLQTTLRRRGISALVTRRAEDGLRIAKQNHPDVIVLDTESVPRGNRTLCQDYDAAAQRENAPLVLVARSRREYSDLRSSHVFSKPYHYAPLIRKIEELLEGDNP